MEIEIPRRWLCGWLYLLLLAGPALLGGAVSPIREDGRPLLLTPRLARLNAYRQEVQGWMREFQRAEDDLAALLDEPSGDLFVQNERSARLYQRMLAVSEGIDRTPVPPTMETLHASLAGTAQAYLDAAILAARWISEPSDENLQVALAARTASQAMMQRLEDNPWIQVQP